MNRLNEIYAKGLFDSLSNEGLEHVLRLFREISINPDTKSLGEVFANKTINKEEKIAVALELVGDNEDLKPSCKHLPKTEEWNYCQIFLAIFWNTLQKDKTTYQ